MSFKDYHFTVSNRFIKYVQIDTQSDPFSETYPSSAKQKNLSRLLAEELNEMGIADVEADQYGCVYATISSNTSKKVPVLCFCSHIDTSPDCSGTDVKPVVHKNYDGKAIFFSDDPQQVLRPEDHPDLKDQLGNDIITASGTTLLGADDKSGLAILMDAAHYLLQHPEIKHGKIRLLFTPDEEIGKGTDKVNLKKLGADYGYTLDGDVCGAFEDENFNADQATIIIDGKSAHPGSAKGKLVNAIKTAGTLLDALPKDKLSPETTEDKEGFIHPVHIEGNAEQAKITFILRNFTEAGLEGHKTYLKEVLEKTIRSYPGAKGKLIVEEQYRNMKAILSQYPEVSEYALEAIRAAGLSPKHNYIRGGTDGAMLTRKGLPCPNIFTGQHAFHSKQEWISIQDMQKAVEVVVRLCGIWEANS